MIECEKIENTIKAYIDNIHETIGGMIIEINELNAELMFVTYLMTQLKIQQEK
ncbi:hypothetical protein IJ541_10220 [bacterium]|nr:hypothetical protein [bacterium]